MSKLNVPAPSCTLVNAPPVTVQVVTVGAMHRP